MIEAGLIHMLFAVWKMEFPSTEQMSKYKVIANNKMIESLHFSERLLKDLLKSQKSIKYTKKKKNDKDWKRN